MGPNPNGPVTSMFPPETDLVCQVLPPHIGYQNGVHFDRTGEKMSSPSWEDFDEIYQQPIFEIQERLQNFKVVLPEQPPLMKPSQEELIVPLDDEFLDQKIMVSTDIFFSRNEFSFFIFRCFWLVQ